MLVASSFDLWQRDTFFSAAEEVQQSADIMESAYRTWLGERRAGIPPEYLDELCRELQMALGTAKWQLEEFERAVSLSYRNSADEITMTRHRQFISAIEGQISVIEESLRESYNMDGRQPLRWVQLDEEERDDLALFLSGNTGVSPRKKHTKFGAPSAWSITEKSNAKNDFDCHSKGGSKKEALKWGKGFDNVETSITNVNSAPDDQAKDILKSRDAIQNEADSIIGSSKIWSCAEIGSLEIVIDNEYGGRKTSTSNIEGAPKEKHTKPAFGRPRCEGHSQGKVGMLSYMSSRRFSLINQLHGYFSRGQRQLQTPISFPYNRSIRFTLVLMLTILLVAPFLFYSA